MKKLLFLFLIAITLFSCKSCPDDTKIGEGYLSKTSLDFISYTGNEYLSFKNSLNETLDFVPRESNGYDVSELLLYTTCSPGWPGRPSYDYVTRDGKVLEYLNDSVHISVMIWLNVIDVLNPAVIDTNWVENVRGDIIDVNNLSAHSFFSIITSTRGKEILPQDILTYNDYLLHDSITILDSAFYNVYSDVNDNIFVNSKGIVGFVYKGELYKLDTIK